MRTVFRLFRKLLRRLDPVGARGIDLALATTPAAGFPFAAVLGPAIGALGGILGARENRRAAEAASRPQPFERHDVSAPWEPAIPYLSDIPGFAASIFANSLTHRPPPSFGGGGPSDAQRQIVDAITGRAMGSQFVPTMQDRLMDFTAGPNPLIQGVYDRAMSYSNPYLDAILGRGLSGAGMNRATPMFNDFLTALLGGNTSLGPSFLGQNASPPPTVPGGGGIKERLAALGG